MINDVILEGIVVKAWKNADDLLFRLACYRDPDLPQKPLYETEDVVFFVKIGGGSGIRIPYLDDAHDGKQKDPFGYFLAERAACALVAERVL